MSTLILYSNILPDTLIPQLKTIFQKNLKNVSLAVIPTAANPYLIDREWFDENMDELKGIGFNITYVDLEDYTGKTKALEAKLKEFDGIYVTGGNTFHLLKHIMLSGFDKILSGLLNEGKIYLGSSAGAIVFNNYMAPIRHADDATIAEEFLDKPGLTGYIPFVVLPHWDNEMFLEPIKNVAIEYIERGEQIITINDNQAVVVKDSNVEIY